MAALGLGVVGAGIGSLRTDGAAALEDRIAACVSQPRPDACLRRVYATAAGAGTVVHALVALESLAREHRLDDCHLEAHRLAHVTLGVVGDVERAFLLGGPQCRLGYLHGAVEATASVRRRDATPHRPLEADRCSRFRYGLQRRGCSHGFGHALMLQNGHDLTASLAGCRAATRRGIGYWSCEQGVMMQNSLRYAELPTLARAAAAGCRTVAASRRLAHLCFDNLGAVAALANRHDAAAATAVCRQLAQTRAASSCLDGVRSEIDEARRAAARP